jgi:hypothetical protein
MKDILQILINYFKQSRQAQQFASSNHIQNQVITPSDLNYYLTCWVNKFSSSVDPGNAPLNIMISKT